MGKATGLRLLATLNSLSPCLGALRAIRSGQIMEGPLELRLKVGRLIETCQVWALIWGEGCKLAIETICRTCTTAQNEASILFRRFSG